MPVLLIVALVLALLIAVAALIFALQNSVTVTIAFLIWHAQMPLTALLLIALGLGALIVLLAALPWMISGRLALARARRRADRLERERVTPTAGPEPIPSADPEAGTPPN